MTDLIVHQYPSSPFSEKLRRVLAYKRLAYKSVRAAAVMPKPDLIALTGGYRKVPVLQVGNHVYCDTALICQVFEARAPEPTLYPTPLAALFAEWADSAFFESSVPMIMRPTRFDLLNQLTPYEQQTFLDDRRALGKDARRIPPGPKTSAANYVMYAQRLDDALQARDYLLGDAPSIADFSVYHSVWSVEQLAPEKLAPFARLHAWLQRIASLPNPAITAISTEAALQISRESSPSWTAPEPFADPTGLQAGQRVSARATDYAREETIGELVHASQTEAVLRRNDDRAGTVYVHFPRLGFEVAPIRD